MNMEEEIYAAIEKNLSAHVGVALKKQLQLLDEYKLRDIENSTKIQNLSEILSTCKYENLKLQNQVHAHGDISKRETEVHTRELKQDLVCLELKYSELRRQDSFRLVELIFKSPSYQKVVSGSIPVSVEGAQGGNGYPGTPGHIVDGRYSNVEVSTQI